MKLLYLYEIKTPFYDFSEAVLMDNIKNDPIVI